MLESDRAHAFAMAAFDFEMAVLPERRKFLPLASSHSVFGKIRSAEAVQSAEAVDPVLFTEMRQSHLYRIPIRQTVSNAPRMATYGTPRSYIPQEFPKVMFRKGAQEIAKSMADQILLQKDGFSVTVN